MTWRGGQDLRRMEVSGFEVKVTGLRPAEKYHFTVCSLREDGHQSTFVEASVYTGKDHITVTNGTISFLWNLGTIVNWVIKF